LAGLARVSVNLGSVAIVSAALTAAEVDALFARSARISASRAMIRPRL
jgi:hypothetical protein